ncbi:hypothetical protein E1B28_013653 [Marasmius oreades]|uniref:HAT C-terminal dimerisation domain-containing protein n=1 Tax=Marasmius oreades TaxID=181124 RepID=A0A9P7UP83_9AGAR|nr:uncharacterized protein E1B28_013653 [Marasmius oreades]KAG7087706.1 hypothetical protein E1B28_013653 [Marasmius oreades]
MVEFREARRYVGSATIAATSIFLKPSSPGFPAIPHRSMSEPLGCAVNPDGSLKEATEIDFPHSASEDQPDLAPKPVLKKKRVTTTKDLGPAAVCVGSSRIKQKTWKLRDGDKARKTTQMGKCASSNIASQSRKKVKQNNGKLRIFGAQQHSDDDADGSTREHVTSDGGDSDDDESGDELDQYEKMKSEIAEERQLTCRTALKGTGVQSVKPPIRHVPTPFSPEMPQAFIHTYQGDLPSAASLCFLYSHLDFRKWDTHSSIYLEQYEKNSAEPNHRVQPTKDVDDDESTGSQMKVTSFVGESDLCCEEKLPRLELIKWIRTRWGSMADLIERALDCRLTVNKMMALADDSPRVPNLKQKKYNDFKIHAKEWKLLDLVLEVLKEPRNAQGAFSSENVPTVRNTLPNLECLIECWDIIYHTAKFAPVQAGIEAGISKMMKYYNRVENHGVYFAAMILVPCIKDAYARNKWSIEDYATGMARFEHLFEDYITDNTPITLAKEMSNLATTSTTSFEGGYGSSWMSNALAARREHEHEKHDPHREL